MLDFSEKILQDEVIEEYIDGFKKYEGTGKYINPATAGVMIEAQVSSMKKMLSSVPDKIKELEDISSQEEKHRLWCCKNQFNQSIKQQKNEKSKRKERPKAGL